MQFVQTTPLSQRLTGLSTVLVDNYTHLLVWLSGSLVRDEALTVPLPGRERLPLADWVS